MDKDTLHEGVEDTVHEGVKDTVKEEVQDTAHEGVEDTAHQGVEDTVHEGFEDTVHEGVEDTAHEGVEDTVHEGFEDTVHEEIEDTVHEGVEDTVHEGVEDTVHEGVEDTVHEGVEDTVHEGVEDTVHEGVEDTVNEEVKDTVKEEVNDTLHEEVQDTVHEGVKDTVQEEVQDTAHEGVEDTLHEEVKDIAHEGVQDTVHEGVQDNVHKGVKDTVQEEVQDTAHEGVEDTLHEEVKDIAHEGVQDTVHEGVQDNVHKGVKDTAREDEVTTESPATDSFSEDEIDYSPPGFDGKTIPEPIRVETSDNKRLERLTKLMTEDEYMTGRTMVYHNIAEALPEDTETIIKNIKRAKQVDTGSRIFLTLSLSDTLRIDYGTPAMVSADALIFAPNFPVAILTFADSSKHNEQCRKYNTYLASWLTATLRDSDPSLSVLHGVVDVHDDLSGTLEKLLQQKLCFAFADSLTMTADRCKKILQYLLQILSSRETNEAMQKPLEPSVLKMWTVIDLSEELSDPSFGDFVGRLSSEVHVVMYVDDPSSLDYSLKSKLTANRVKLVDKRQEESELESALYLAGSGKHTLCSINTLPEEKEVVTDERMSEKAMKINNFLVWEFVLCIVQFILTYKGDNEGSIDLAEQKIIPVFVLLCNLARLSPVRHQKEYWFLTSALFLLCIGDILFLWSRFINLGIIVFAVVNMIFATAFGFRLDKLNFLSLVFVLGVFVFQTISLGMDGQTYFIVLLYTASVCLLVWRVYACIETSNNISPLVILQVLSMVCFVAYNVISGYKFLNPNLFPGADILSKLTYYFTVLGGTVCLIYRYDLFADNMKRTKWLECLSILSLLVVKGWPVVKFHLGRL